jgi:hypothetical protein
MSTVEGGLTVIDWAGAVITPANTIAAATAQVINAFISCLSFPFLSRASLARTKAQEGCAPPK